MLLLTAVVATTAAALVPPPTTDTIVVTGVRLKELRAADARCAKDGCGIRDDVIASVRYAEALFGDGRYTEARRILGRSVSRNRSRARQDPRAMSELYVAQANVARHYGDPARESIAIQGGVRVLADSSADDGLALGATLGLGDYFVRRGDMRYGESRYVAVAKQAQATGQKVLAKSAELHSAWLLHLRGRSRQAIAQLSELAALTGEDMRGVRLGSRILLYRIARAGKDDIATRRYFAAIESEPPVVPILMWEPVLPPPTANQPIDRFSGVAQDFSSGTTLRWADIEYQIMPSGGVEHVVVTRGDGEHSWTAPIVDMIRGRLYTRIPLAPGSQPVTRTERYSLTATFDDIANSKIPRRVINPRYERLDMTQLPPTPEAPEPEPAPAG